MKLGEHLDPPQRVAVQTTVKVALRKSSVSAGRDHGILGFCHPAAC